MNKESKPRLWVIVIGTRGRHKRYIANHRNIPLAFLTKQDALNYKHQYKNPDMHIVKFEEAEQVAKWKKKQSS